MTAGRKGCDARLEFYRTKELCNKTQYWHVCRHCSAAEEPAYKSASTRTPHQAARVFNGAEAPPVKKQRQATIREFCPTPLDGDRLAQWHTLLLEFQAESLAPASYVELPSFKRLIQFANFECALGLPTRRDLGGRILARYGDPAMTQDTVAMKSMMAGGLRVNETTAKTHLLGVILAVAGHVSLYGTYQCGDRHDAIAVSKQLHVHLKAIQDDGWVGAVATDNAGSCARARRFLALKWPRVVFRFCFAHQVLLLVKDLLKTPLADVLSQAQAVAKWLTRLYSIMNDIYKVQLAVLAMADTRWNTMQAMLASLLRCKSAFIMLYVKWHNNDDFPPALVALSPTGLFWDRIAAAETIVRPLSVASFRLQRDNNMLADVILNYGNIFLSYTQYYLGNYDERSTLVASIEKRWNDVEQPLVILTLFLHPKYRTLFSTLRKVEGMTTVMAMGDIAVTYVEKLLGLDVVGVRQEVRLWEMNPLAFGITPFEFIGPTSALDFWGYVLAASSNRSRLSKLALAVLSVSINTATYERLFSKLALVWTAKRNKLHPDKATKLCHVRAAVRRKNKPVVTDGPHADAPGDDASKCIVDATERKQLEPTADVQCISMTHSARARVGVNSGAMAVEGYAQVIDVASDYCDDDNYVDDDADGSDPSKDGREHVREWLSMLDDLEVDEDGADCAVNASDDTMTKLPLPEHNDLSYPQEPTGARLTGVRGRKATLMALLDSLGPSDWDFDSDDAVND
ncbi:hypothetical protein ACHHYP_11229 [Achlya hypogyna]|uniref:HAT C-terminal dimerisation domain-containing protein n=1 Tax=Achlya hypogyna TaxID=1202772 RepID=A0A1V9YJH8_ACHHY|nr:hypothetical protein ACHHYP_11229 [Achlya hypogyna]